MKKLIPLVLCVMLACLAVVPAFADEVTVHGASFDTVIINGDEAPAAVNFGLGDGAASNKLDQLEPARLVDGSEGDISKITLRGWLGFESNDIVSFGYRIGTVDTFDESFFEERLDIGAIQQDGNGGPRAQAFKIHIDVSGVKGTKEIVALAKLDNGEVVAIDSSVPKHGEGTTPNTSFTYVGIPAPVGSEPRSFDASQGDGLSYDTIYKNEASQDNMLGYANEDDKIPGIPGVPNAKKLIDGTDKSIEKLLLYGWYGNANSPTKRLGYSIDGGEIVYGEFFAEPEQDGLGGPNTKRFMIVIPVADLEGDGHEIWVYAELENGEVVKLDRYDNRGTGTNEKDREIYVVYNGPAAQQGGQQGGQNPGTADASMVIFVVAAAAIALIILKKKVF